MLTPSRPGGGTIMTRTSATACLNWRGGSSEALKPKVVCCRLAAARKFVVRNWSEVAPCSSIRRVVISALSCTCSARISEAERPILLGAVSAVEAGAVGTLAVIVGCVVVVLFCALVVEAVTCCAVAAGTVVTVLEELVPAGKFVATVHPCVLPLPMVGKVPGGHCTVTVPWVAPVPGTVVVVVPVVPPETVDATEGSGVVVACTAR